MSDDFQNWVNKVSQWKSATSSIPALVRDDIHKGRKRLRIDDPARGVRSLDSDPLTVQYAMGYKDRRYSLTYEVLKRITHQLSIVGAIIQTRQNQVAQFSVPFRSAKSVGFQIKHKDPSRLTTESERNFIKQLEQFVYSCGSDDKNPYNEKKRDDFETFLKKIVRDSLTYDQACFEVIPTMSGLPFEFVAVDASTIRIAASKDEMFGDPESWHSRPYPVNNPKLLQPHGGNPYKTLRLRSGEVDTSHPAFLQVVNGQIENVFAEDELAFGVRNPRTDIYIQGYGYGELEQLITIISAHLNAEEYNRRFFTQGSSPKGILNIKGDNITPDQFETFKRQWRSNLEGVHNAWRTPILQSEQGLEWIDLHPSNREMEYGQWMEYLIKITCAVFLIDPAELNFDLHGGVQQTPLFESSQEWKLKASRDRGLKPLLRFLAKLINEHVIAPIDDHFVFDFVGLDELTEQEKHEMRKEQVATYKTLNEVRREDDLPDIEGGDVPMNPTFLQSKQIELQMKQQEQQQQQGQEQQAGAVQAVEQDDSETAQDDSPSYADGFTKSLKVSSGDKYLEIDLSELDDWKSG